MAAEPSGIVTLLTDFGLDDPYVGQMKGAVLRGFPSAVVVDLTHAVPPQDVRAGAFWLAASFGHFPSGTVHVAVVDPGVGGPRSALAVRAGGYFFVGPDNGLLAAAVEAAGPAEPRRLSPERLALAPEALSRTFHGRDLFAPVAAALAAGKARFEDLGPGASGMEPSPLRPPAVASGGVVEGEVVVVDRFGNLITNIPAHLLPAGPAEVRCGRARCTVAGTYCEVEPRGVAAVVNSQGFLEVAVREGSAAQVLRAGPGTPVAVAPGAGDPSGAGGRA